MSRMMTISELYALLLHTQKSQPPRTQPAMQLHDAAQHNQHAEPPLTSVATKPERQVRVTRDMLERMEQVAHACGISPSEAWTEAASTWVAQRQCDMAELASPMGKTLHQSMHQIWSVIDEQMCELRQH